MEYRFPQPKPKSALSDFQKKRLKDRLQQIAYLQRQQDMQDDYTTKLYGKKDYQSEREELEAQLETAGELLGSAHIPTKKDDDESQENKIYLKNKKKQEEESKSSSEKDSSPASSSEETPEKVQEAIDDYKRENPKEYKERIEELKRNGSEEFQPEQTDHGGGSVLDIAKNTGKYTLENAREKVNSIKESGSNFVNSIKSFFAGKEKTDPLQDQSNSNKTIPSLEDWQKRDQEYQKNKQPHCNTTLGIELKPRGINLPFNKDMNGIIKEIEKSSDWKTLPRKENGTLDHKTANDIAQTGKTVIATQTGTEKDTHGHGVVLTGNKRMKDSPNWGNVEVPEIKGSKGINPVETCYFNWHFKKANENNIEYRVYQGQQTNEDK